MVVTKIPSEKKKEELSMLGPARMHHGLAMLGALSLFGCSSEIQVLSTPPAGPQRPTYALQRAQIPGWVNLNDLPTVFISDYRNGVVNGYSQKTGKMTEQLTGLSRPTGLAVDESATLYVVNQSTQQVFVYKRGSTQPSLKLTIPAGPNFDVAVSSTGEVAVPVGGCCNAALYFFKKGATSACGTVGPPKPDAWFNYAAYDAHGDLWVNISYQGGGSGGPPLGEIKGGCRATHVITFNPTVAPPGDGIAVDSSNHLLVCCGTTGSSGPALLYQYRLPNPTSSPKIISLNAGFAPDEIALTSSEKAIYCADSPVTHATGGAYRFKYPQGGDPTQHISVQYLGTAGGIAVSPPAAP